MEIPLIIGGKETGKLSVSKCGLYTVMEAALESAAPEIIRLWAHGGGRSACLGVMEPRDGDLWLQRRLTRLELRDFPEPIEYVSDSKDRREQDIGEERAEAELAAIERGEGNSGQSDPTENENEEQTQQNETYGLQNADMKEIPSDAADELPPHRETDMRACPWPAAVPEEGLTWYTRPDGSLVSFDGISNLLALPSGLKSPVPQTAERIIEGKKYLVFRY